MAFLQPTNDMALVACPSCRWSGFLMDTVRWDEELARCKWCGTPVEFRFPEERQPRQQGE